MVRLMRSGNLVSAQGISPAAEAEVKKALEYEERQMQPDGRGGLQNVVLQRRLWAKQSDQSLVFPCGFARRVSRIIEAMGQKVEEYQRVDNRPKNLEYRLENIDARNLRDEQKAFLTAIVAYEGGLIVSPTGSGKSYGMRELCALYPESRIIIAAPGIEAVATLRRYLEERFPKQVGQVGGGRRATKRITVATFDSLTKVDHFESVDILIVDEVHRAPATKYATAVSACTSPIKRFGFTATPEGRSDNKEIVNEAWFGPILVEFNYADSVQNGTVSELRVLRLISRYGPDEEWLKSLPVQRRDRYAIWRNNNRNQLIAIAAQALIGDGDPQILIICSKAEHVYALREYLPDFTIVTGEQSGKDLARLKKRGLDLEFRDLVSSKQRDYYRRQFEQGKLRRVIATKIWKEALSADQCSIVIYAAGDASTIDFSQSKGRASRLHGTKQYGTVVVLDDVFAEGYKRRSRKLLKAAKSDGHQITDWNIQLEGVR